MNGIIYIARIINPREARNFIEVFEFEGTIHELFVTLIRLDEEIQKKLLRGLLVFPEDVKDMILKKIILEDEDIKQAASLVASSVYTPGITNIYLTDYLGTTKYIVCHVSHHPEDMHVLRVAYHRNYVKLVYFGREDKFVVGDLSVHSTSWKKIVYHLLISEEIDKGKLEKKATFDNLVELIRRLYKSYAVREIREIEVIL